MFKKPVHDPRDRNDAPLTEPSAEPDTEADVQIARHRPTIKSPAAAHEPRKSPRAQKPAAKGDPGSSHSVIDEWLTMRGDIETDGNIHVKGRVFGNISCVSIIVEDGAIVDGEIQAEDVSIRGQTSGTITGKSIKLESSAVVESDIFHQSFACEQGARIEGRLSFKSAASEAGQTPGQAQTQMMAQSSARAGSRIIDTPRQDNGVDPL